MTTPHQWDTPDQLAHALHDVLKYQGPTPANQLDAHALAAAIWDTGRETA